MSSDAVIKTENLSKCYHIYENPKDRLMQMLLRGKKRYYREFWALRDVSFELKKGETVGVVGRNGSGKSTLLQMICGTLNPTFGKLESFGRVAALLELGAGFNPEFTGRENVYMNATILGLSGSEIDACYDEIVKFADIGDFIDQPVKMYSSGMYVRLAFAVVINVSPDILIIDEALAVGDARFQAKCYEKIKRMKDQGVTLLFVSHDVGAVKTLCDHAIWLEKGKIVSQGDVRMVTSDYVRFLFQNDSSDIAISEQKKRGSTEMTKGEGAPINHWGSDIGSVQEAGIYNINNEPVNVINSDEQIFIKIRFVLPAEINRESFGAGFAFRSLSGTDLLVSSTCEHGIKFENKNDERQIFEVQFSMSNPLNAGRYMLVAILEDRSAGVPEYYEFIEGIQYFTVVFDKQRYGAVYLNKFINVVSNQVYGDVK